MNTVRYALLSALFISSAAPALAQTAVPATPVIMGTDETSVLRAGTPVPLKMRETLTTKGKKLKVGYRFQMEVAADVELNGMVVIPAGSPATGEVTDVRNKGMWGKSGHISARALFVRVNGRQLRLTGQVDDKGITGTAGVVGALVVIPVAGFFVTGTSAVIPTDTPVNAFLDEDVAIAFKPAEQQPAVMTVEPAPAVEPAAAATE